MIKIKTGSTFGKPGSDVADKEVVIPVSSPIGLKDVLIGDGIITAGVIYLICAAFDKGAKAFEREELYTMRDAGIIDWDPEEVLDGKKWKWSWK